MEFLSFAPVMGCASRQKRIADGDPDSRGGQLAVTSAMHFGCAARLPAQTVLWHLPESGRR